MNKKTRDYFARLNSAVSPSTVVFSQLDPPEVDLFQVFQDCFLGNRRCPNIWNCECHDGKTTATVVAIRIS